VLCASVARVEDSFWLAVRSGQRGQAPLAAYDELAADGLIEGRRGSRMAVSAPSRGLHALDPKRMLSDAQFPERTVTIVDPDGTPLYLRY